MASGVSNSVFLVSFLSCLLLLPGCMTTKISQHNLPCHSRTQTDVIRSATSILVMNGFRITISDTTVGLVQAETEESRNIWTGYISKRIWQINITPRLDNNIDPKSGNKAALEALATSKPLYIIATAKETSKSQNAFGATLLTTETYYDDDAHKDWEWYWAVRKGLENLCGATSVITVKKMY